MLSFLVPLQILVEGWRNRATASTALNAHSSRSHALLSVRVTAKTPDGSSHSSTIHLVDLAGGSQVKMHIIIPRSGAWCMYVFQVLTLFHFLTASIVGFFTASIFAVSSCPSRNPPHNTACSWLLLIHRQ